MHFFDRDQPEVVQPKPGQQDADRISKRVFDRIEYDGTLIRQNVAEEIREGLLLRDAERGGGGDVTADMKQLVETSHTALRLLEAEVLNKHVVPMLTMQALSALYQLTLRFRKTYCGV